MNRTALAATLCLLTLPVSACAQDGHIGHAAHASPAQASSSHSGHSHADFVSERLHVRVDGPQGAPDLILIPGLSSSPRIWDSTVAHLDGRYRIHRIHVQGFAGAPAKANATGPVAAPVAAEIARYISEMGLNRPAVIGHSMGGTMGMMLAARYPDQVGRLMVVDMIPFMGAMFGAPGVTAEQVAPIADQIYAGMLNAPEAAYRAQATASIVGMINTESLRAGPISDAEASDRAVSSSAYRELIVTDLRPELANIKAPVEVLYVKFNDPRMTTQITDMMYSAAFANLTGASLRRIDESAHFIMFDQPGLFFERVDAFLGQ